MLSAFAFVWFSGDYDSRREKRTEAERPFAGSLKKRTGRLQNQLQPDGELARVMERNRLARDITTGLAHYLTTSTCSLRPAQRAASGRSGRAMEAVVKAHGLPRRLFGGSQVGGMVESR